MKQGIEYRGLIWIKKQPSSYAFVGHVPLISNAKKK